MRSLISSVRPSGHVVFVRLPEGAAFTARYRDDAPGEAREITELVADLLLSGALDAAEVRQSGRPEPSEQVQVAVVSYTEPLLPGQVRAAASFSWAHLPSGQAQDFDPREVLALVTRGIGVEITAGVAAESAAVPDTAESAEPSADAQGSAHD